MNQSRLTAEAARCEDLDEQLNAARQAGRLLEAQNAAAGAALEDAEARNDDTLREVVSGERKCNGRVNEGR